MPDYSSWPEKPLPVTTLLLDPNNPRMPPPGAAQPSQRQLIEELVEHDDVYELARDIVQTGYIPVESLIGLNDGDKTYVLEGNRRLAALKLLLNPELAPASAAKKFRTLAGPITGQAVKKVRVLLAPTREAAAVLILHKHTREQVLRWSPLMQARFYRKLASNGASLEEMSRRYGVPVGEIVGFLRMDAMYEIAWSLDKELTPDAREKVRNPRRFPASVLQRLMDIPKARGFLRLSFDDTGKPSANAKPEQFRKAFARILTDITSGEVDTRAVNKVEDAERYLLKIAEVAPAKQTRTVPMEDLLGPQASVSAPSAEPPAERRAPVPRRSSALIPSSLRCTLSDVRAREIFAELRAFRARFPNAHGVLLRILLEFGVVNYLKKTRKWAPLVAKLGKGKKPDWAPTLKQMLTELLADPDITLEPLTRKALNRMVSQRDALISVDTLDAFVHNPHVLPDLRNLALLWQALEGVFQLVLQEPKPPSRQSGPRPANP